MTESVTLPVRIDRHLPIVANGFRVLGVVLGVPSLAGFLVAAFTVLRIHFNKTPDVQASRSPDGMVNVLETGAYVFGKAFQFLGDLGEWIITGMAVVLFLLSLLAVLLFFTGRGLRRHQAWAKIVASLVAFWLLLISSVSFLSLARDAAMFLPLMGASASVYALWALWRRVA